MDGYIVSAAYYALSPGTYASIKPLPYFQPLAMWVLAPLTQPGAEHVIQPGQSTQPSLGHWLVHSQSCDKSQPNQSKLWDLCWNTEDPVAPFLLGGGEPGPWSQKPAWQWNQSRGKSSWPMAKGSFGPQLSSGAVPNTKINQEVPFTA